jgi:hypothetical protein
MIRSNYDVHIHPKGKLVLLTDTGWPWDRHFTITNDAENVVADLTKQGIINNTIQVIYYDSENVLTELLHENGEFKGFRSRSSKTRDDHHPHYHEEE